MVVFKTWGVWDRPVNTAGRAVEAGKQASSPDAPLPHIMGMGQDTMLGNLYLLQDRAEESRAGSIKKQGRVPAPKTDVGKNHVTPEIRSPDTLHMLPQTS